MKLEYISLLEETLTTDELTCPQQVHISDQMWHFWDLGVQASLGCTCTRLA